jgi:hypothetical protein
MHQHREIDLLNGFESNPRDPLHHLKWNLKAWVDLECDSDIVQLAKKDLASKLLYFLEHKHGWYCPTCGMLSTKEVENHICKLCGDRI